MGQAVCLPFFSDTPNRVPERPVLFAPPERSTAEAHVTGVRTTGQNRRRPVAAFSTLTDGHTVNDVPIARSRQH